MRLAGRITQTMTSRRSIFRHFLFTLLLLAIVARSAIPAGYMPGEAKANGGMTVIVCDGNMKDGHHHPPPAHGKDNSSTPQHVPCVFSAAFNLASDTSVPPLPLPILLAAYVPDALAAPFHHQLLTHQYFAQGPPVLLQS